MSLSGSSTTCKEVAEEVKIGGGTTSIAELLEQFLFPRSTHGTLIEKLSGGEKRLYLLKLLWKSPIYCFLTGRPVWILQL